MKAILFVCLIAIAFAVETTPVAAETTNVTVVNTPSLSADAAKLFNEKKVQLQAAFEKRINLEAHLAVLKKTQHNAQVALKSALKTLKVESAQLKVLGKRLQAAFGHASSKVKNATRAALNSTTGQKVVNATNSLINSTKNAMNSETAQNAMNVTRGWAAKAGNFLRKAANATKHAVNNTIENVKASNYTQAAINATKNALNSEAAQNAMNATKSAFNTTKNYLSKKSAGAWELKDSLITKVSEQATVQTLIKTLRVQQQETLAKIQAKITELRQTSAAVKKFEVLVKQAKAKTQELMSA